MRYRKLGPNLDYTFGNGQLDFYRDEPAAVGQAVQTRLLLWQGEWFLNIDEGTPYMIGVLGKKSIAMADATLQDRINGTEGFVDFEEFESEIDSETRRYSFQATINTIYGPTAVDIKNYVNF